MCAISQFRVRKLTGQTRVPYNRGLRVRGSPHPFDYGAVLPPLAIESNDFPVMLEESFRKFEVRSPSPKKSEGPNLE
jgi:hypothetical protein